MPRAAFVAAVLVLGLSAAAGQSKPSEPLELVRAIPLDGVEGRIDHLALDQKKGVLYVAALENGTVEAIDLAAGKQARRADKIGEPQGVCILPKSGQLVVASGGDGKVRMFGESFALLGAVQSLEDADNVRFDAQADRLYVGYGAGALAVIDPQKQALVRDVPLSAHPESFQLEAKGKRIFVNVPRAEHVAVVDREKGAVIATWPVREAKANYPMALDEDARRLFIACRKPAKLLALDTDSGRVVASVDCCGDADDVFCDLARKRIYVSGGEGAISVFDRKDGDQYPLRQRVATAAGARTCLFVPETDRLFLAVPRRDGQRAEIREYKAGAP